MSAPSAVSQTFVESIIYCPLRPLERKENAVSPSLPQTKKEANS